MRFAYLSVFCASLFFPIFFLYSLWKKDLLEKETCATLSDSQRKNQIFLKRNIYFFCCTMSLFLLCLARPQAEYSIIQTAAKGSEVIFILDISRSMLVQDVLPNRLDIAKQSLLDLAMSLKTGDQAGLLVFSGKCVILCPVTPDHNTLRKQIQVAHSKIIRQQGTILCTSIENAYSLFSKKKNKKLIIIATDGEIHEEEILPRLEKILLPDIKIHIIVTGTLRGGNVPLSENVDKQIRFLKDKSGKLVISKPNLEICTQISKKTLGIATLVTQNNPNLKNIRDDLVSSEKKDATTILLLQSGELFQPIAILLWILLLGECFLSKRFGGFGDVL